VQVLKTSVSSHCFLKQIIFSEVKVENFFKGKEKFDLQNQEIQYFCKRKIHLKGKFFKGFEKKPVYR